MTDTHDLCDLRGVYLEAHCGGCENTYPRDLEHTDWRFWAFCAAECEQNAMPLLLAEVRRLRAALQDVAEVECYHDCHEGRRDDHCGLADRICAIARVALAGGVDDAGDPLGE